MLQLQRLRSVEGSAIVSFALGAPLVVIITLSVINIAGIMWSREVASNLLNRLAKQASREGADLDVISNRWQSAISQSHLKATPIQWTVKRIGSSTRVIVAHTEVELLTIGLPLEQRSSLDVQVVME